jgi:type III pantothenate kinase
VADVGNSRVHWGPVLGTRVRPRRPLATSRIARLPRLRGECAAACVVPRAEAALRRRWPRVRFLGRDFPAAVPLRGPDPRQVGADRWANAAAAWARCRGACVVVDVGSAVTYDVVSSDGAFLGGAIAPGLGLGSAALHRCCALLPLVPPARARRAVAVTTARNIQAGLYWGLRGAISGTLSQIRRERGRRLTVLGSGGDAGLFADLFDAVVPTLTLEGVAISYRAWKRSSGSAD